ncbi:type II toxin-antitoxin system Phd/YefM family antitoxin [Marinobacter sp. V034]|uniref:type II toxin-antitoxin system Phd/YefM family antitoxin n=1 Tax=Marinobacter sp. V034 TaxID=3459610 RepID=UPI004044C409
MRCVTCVDASFHSIHICTVAIGESKFGGCSVLEAQEKLAKLVDAVASGKEIVILRHGKPAARMIPAVQESVIFPDRSELRRSLRPAGESASKAIGALRDNDH